MEEIFYKIYKTEFAIKKTEGSNAIRKEQYKHIKTLLKDQIA